MYKKSSKQKLRIITAKGLLSVEQLWDLTLQELDECAIVLQDLHKKSGKKSFLEAKSPKDATLKLKLDIVVDVLTSKVEIANTATKSADTKAHNQKILGLIARKQEGELEGKSVEELQGMLK
jgi:hypothetical protein